MYDRPDAKGYYNWRTAFVFVECGEHSLNIHINAFDRKERFIVNVDTFIGNKLHASEFELPTFDIFSYSMTELQKKLKTYLLFS